MEKRVCGEKGLWRKQSPHRIENVKFQLKFTKQIILS